MSAIAFIPARGGSTRIPRKNLALVGGVSLLDRAMFVGHETCDRVVVSTDDAEIAAAALADGAEVHERPADLAGPTAQIEDAIAHWFAQRPSLADDDVIVLLQPTSPLRTVETVRRVIDGAHEYGSSLTVTPCPEAWVTGDLVRLPEDGLTRRLWTRDPVAVSWDRSRYEPRPRSQDAVSVREDGCAYAFTLAHWREHRLRMAPRSAPHVVVISRWESLEVDDPADLAAARQLAQFRGRS